MKIQKINNQKTFGAKFNIVSVPEGMITADEIAKLSQKAELVGSKADIIQAEIGKIFGTDENFLKSYPMRILTSINEKLEVYNLGQNVSHLWNYVYGRPYEEFKMPFKALSEFIDNLATKYPSKSI